eukprot:scaffold370_cov349-Pavlova_lutheri.AAC.5
MEWDSQSLSFPSSASIPCSHGTNGRLAHPRNLRINERPLLVEGRGKYETCRLESWMERCLVPQQGISEVTNVLGKNL